MLCFLQKYCKMGKSHLNAPKVLFSLMFLVMQRLVKLLLYIKFLLPNVANLNGES